MSQSRRARRMARNHRRNTQPARLNLVALMDIFTILVLFLIVNNSDVEVLQPDRRVALPDSVSEQRPASSLVMKITPSDILLGEEFVMSVDDAMLSDGDALAPLSLSLLMAKRNTALWGDVESEEYSVVIMGDQSTPYALLKRVLATSANAGYHHVSLAVDSRPVPVQDIAFSQLSSSGVAR